MSLRKHLVTTLIVGISIVLAIWPLALSWGGGWLSDAPGYPFSLIAAGLWFVCLSLGLSLARLRTATGSLRIVRFVSVIAASIFVLGMLLSSINLITQGYNQPISFTLPFWLLIIGLILSNVANLIETGWGKTNLRGWLHVSGAAVIGAIILISILLAWSTLR